MSEKLRDMVLLAIDEALANIHTSTIAKVIKVNQKTIDVKPVFNRVINGESIELPVFLDVLPLTLSGGASHIIMPIAVGDYCLLNFTERCTDTWFSGSDFVAPAEFRMHDYSDGFAYIGVHNSSSAIDIPTVITIKGDSHETGNQEIIGNKTRVGNEVITGDVTITGILTVGGVVVNGHTHLGDSGGTTGGMQ